MQELHKLQCASLSLYVPVGLSDNLRPNPHSRRLFCTRNTEFWDWMSSSFNGVHLSSEQVRALHSHDIIGTLCFPIATGKSALLSLG